MNCALLCNCISPWLLSGERKTGWSHSTWKNGNVTFSNGQCVEVFFLLWSYLACLHSGYGLSELCCIITTTTICWSLPGARTWTGRAFLQAQTAGLWILLLNVLIFTTPQCLSKSCCCLSVLWHRTWVNLLWPYPLSQPFDKVWGPGLILDGSCSFSRVSNLKLSVFFLWCTCV